MSRPTGTHLPDQVPTWLYQAVHLTGTVRVVSDSELGPHLDALSAKFESWLAPKPPWLVSKVTAGRLDMLKKAIVGLVMSVEEVEGSFKLNQTNPTPITSRSPRRSCSSATKPRARSPNRWSRCGRSWDYKSSTPVAASAD